MPQKALWQLVLLSAFLLIVSGTALAEDQNCESDADCDNDEYCSKENKCEDSEDDDDEGFLGDTGEGLGTAAAWGLAFSTSIIIWKPGLKYIRANADKIVEDGRWLKKKLGKANRWYLKIHYWVGASAVLVGFIHGVAMNKWEVLFWGGWVGMLFMSVTGSLLLWKWPPRKVKKGARLLHAQRAVLVITIVLLFVSHEFFD